MLGTRLFEGVSPGLLAPAHSQIAEFLAARHVSGLLDTGLPLGRVLALITGFDGELLPSFQNFVSWLAVHSKPSRKRLSRYHASGLIYTGEAGTYSVDEKREIVRNLRQEVGWNRWCSPGTRKVSGIGVIVSPDLEGTFLEILSDPARDDEHQSYVMLLMQLLAAGEPLPTLAGALEETVRDGRWKEGVRRAALDVLTGYAAQGRLGFEALASMAGDIRAGNRTEPSRPRRCASGRSGSRPRPCSPRSTARPGSSAPSRDTPERAMSSRRHGAAPLCSGARGSPWPAARTAAQSA